MSSQTRRAIEFVIERVLFLCAAGSHSFFSSATVIEAAQVFFGFTTTAIPS